MKLLPLLLMFIGVNSLAVDPSNDVQKGKGTITGQVIDNITSEPLEFATVTIMSSDSAIVNGTLTNAQGLFEFKDLDDASYIIKADFIGYSSVYIDTIIAAGNRKLNIGQINLTPAGNLDEVIVEGEKSAYTVEIDKKVYDPSKNPINEGGTGLDVLRNMPSIEVDADDNISLRGDQNVNILLDGRPVAMSMSQLLKQIPASSIEKVEVITNPSAKYDPEGTSGIINVVLKKNDTKGFNGSVNLSYGRGFYGPDNNGYNKFNGGLSLNYLSDKVNISASGNLWNGKFGYGGSNDRNIYGPPESGLYSIDKGYRSGINPFARMGVDYFLNDRNTLYLSGSYTPGRNESRRDIDYIFTEDDVVQGTSNRIGFSDGENNSYEVNGGWQKKFKDPDHTFYLDAKMEMSETPTNESIGEYGYDSNNNYLGSIAKQETFTNNSNNVMYVRADYTNPIKDSLKLEAGFHYTGKIIGSDFYSESYNYASDSYEPDSALNNEFEYSQLVYAGYVTLGKQFKKWAIKGGLRAEQTNTLAELVTTGEKFRNDYFELFPSLHMTFGANALNQWQLSYSRRINRPSTHEINPFTQYTDPYTLQKGNPFLMPEFIHVMEAGHSLIKKNITLNSSLYYRLITDQKRRYLELLDGGVSQVSYDNLTTAHLKGAEIIFGYNPGKVIRTTTTFNYWHSNVIDTTLAENNNTVNSGWSVDVSIMGNLGKGFTAQITGDYRGKMEVVQGSITPMYGIDLALRKRILKNRGSVGIRIQDVFKTRQFTFVGDDLDGYDFTTYRYWESRQVWVSFSYFFGKMMKGKQRDRLSDKDASDDRDIPDIQ